MKGGCGGWKGQVGVSGISKWVNLGTVAFAITLTLTVLPAWNASSHAVLDLGVARSLDFTLAKYVGVIAALFYVGFSCLSVPRRYGVSLVVASAVLMAAGYAGLFLDQWGAAVAAEGEEGLAEVGEWRMVVEAFLIGAGAGCSFVLWPRVFADEARGMGRRQLLAGTALMPLFYHLVKATPNLTSLAVVTFTLIAANTVLLPKCLSHYVDDGLPKSYSPVFSLGNRRLFLTLARYMVCIAVIGYASGTSQALVFVGDRAAVLDTVSALAMPVSAAVLALVWEVLKVEFPLRKAFLVILLVDVTSFSFLLLTGEGFSLVLASVCFFVFSIASMLMFAACVETARARGADASAVFGVFVGFVYAFLVLGLYVTGRFEVESEFSNTLAVGVGAIYLIAVACIAVGMGGREREQVEIEGDSSVSFEPAKMPENPTVRVTGSEPVASGTDGLKETYCLSDREAEVLELLMRGNSVSRIADILFLSQNTVKTHCRSLYGKMGVHSRQELVDMLASGAGNRGL